MDRMGRDLQGKHNEKRNSVHDFLLPGRLVVGVAESEDVSSLFDAGKSACRP